MTCKSCKLLVILRASHFHPEITRMANMCKIFLLIQFLWALWRSVSSHIQVGLWSIASMEKVYFLINEDLLPFVAMLPLYKGIKIFLYDAILRSTSDPHIYMSPQN